MAHKKQKKSKADKRRSKQRYALTGHRLTKILAKCHVALELEPEHYMYQKELEIFTKQVEIALDCCNRNMKPDLEFIGQEMYKLMS